MKLSFVLLAVIFTSFNLIHADESKPISREIVVKCDKVNLSFDQTEITVEAGEPIQLLFINPEGATQPHNIIFVQPGKALRVGMLVNRKMSDPEFIKDPNPRTADVLFASRLLQPGEEELLEFKAPETPGEYPYLCTFPGHWAVMKGIMRVTERPDSSL